ncbi:tRNA (adenosine(37)-N6)-threonylcarbamoyltransferase complex transferase subunit TsaD [Candidatus Woesebacteria bacterium]|nr:tRNA (adenosine(37)-N6)-threonylcarbamoyltransferase complex transferase subunit TsaD [Candidatus Woesebacteria bacterium]
MTILAIDTSFDDTAVAITRKRVVLSNVLSTDQSLHAQWGGVVPNLARLHHQENIDTVIAAALKRANCTWDSIDAIAVTRGPGLAVALEVGIAKARELALSHGKKLLEVNHMEGHLLSWAALSPKTALSTKTKELENLFPALGILISGGHTQFVYTTGIGHYEVVGQTQDDAIGECFDKVGRMLLLGYPAGKMVEWIAKKGSPGKFVFPVPMRQVKSADTSYSGLKTAAMRMIEPLKEANLLSQQTIADIAYAFQYAAVKHLTEKLQFALTKYPVKSLLIGGGVAANLYLREELRNVASQHKLQIKFPRSRKLCTDNAAMIGIVAYLHPCEVATAENLDRLPNWKLDQ